MKRTTNLFIFLLIGTLLIIPTVSALPDRSNYLNHYYSKYSFTRPQLSTSYSPTSAYIDSYDYSREDIASKYGLNPIYLYNSSYPGAHTVYTAEINVALFPGVNKTLIDESLKGVNPFYHFNYVDYRSVKTFINEKTGMLYSGDRHTMIITMVDNPCSVCGCGSTHGTAYLGVQIWIKNGDNPKVEYMSWLINHELDHIYGLPCRNEPDYEETVPGNYWDTYNITARYTEQTKEYGKVTINSFKGSNPEEWNSWTVYI
jgi:hypothetical protein